MLLLLRGGIKEPARVSCVRMETEWAGGDVLLNKTTPHTQGSERQQFRNQASGVRRQEEKLESGVVVGGVKDDTGCSSAFKNMLRQKTNTRRVTRMSALEMIAVDVEW